MEPPGWSEDSHPSDSNGAREAGLASSTVARLSGPAAAMFGSCLSSTAHVLWGHWQRQRLCKARGKSRWQRLSLQRSGVLFSLEFTSAQQPGTRIPWRPDLLLLPSGKAEFQIDLPVLPSRCCCGMTSELKTA